MSKIILVRHGPVALKAPGLLSFEDFGRYIAAYELSGLDAQAAAPEGLAGLVDGARVFASDAPRVANTLERLGVAAAHVDAAFREAPPIAPRLPLKMPGIAWLALARARGTYDPALAAEREDLRRRAGECAERLIAASGMEPVALVGHGWFNRHVARDLAGRGWRKADGPGFGKPWGFAVFNSPA